jgi:hydroxymethylpyrimidine pyrophosphatase-like HAD family hydrolase
VTAVELAGQSAADDPDWRPKLVALDLDGTVVGYREFDAAPSAAVRAAVDAVREAGVPVIVATGRPVWGALPTAEHLDLHGIELVCSNGAVVYDGGTGRVVHEVALDPGPAVRPLAALAPTAGFAVESGADGWFHTAEFVRDFPGPFLGEVSLDELAAMPTPRLVCRAEDYPSDEAAAIAAKALQGLPYGWDIGYSSWIDVMAPGVSKASGVALVAADLGIAAADVLAIGDGSNDVELFSWVGHAVAMGQARDSVQAAAHAVTDTVDNDGVALALARWFGR